VSNAPLALHRYLLLEERVEYDGRPSGILQALDRIDAIAERRRAGDERMREAHAEI
jgi:hypothetical protein